MDPEAVEMAEASLNVLFAHFHRYQAQFERSSVTEMYSAMLKQDGLGAGTSGWLQQLGEVEWVPRPTFSAN